jgi:hypothetical protein
MHLYHLALQQILSTLWKMYLLSTLVSEELLGLQIMIFLGILVLDLLMRYSWMQAISKMVRLYSMKATQSSMVSTEPHGKN